MIISVLTYVKSIQEVEHYLSEHNNYLDKYYKEKKFIASGRRNPRIGGVILMDTSLEEAKKISQEDPFLRYGVADYEYMEFSPSKCDLRFIDFLK